MIAEPSQASVSRSDRFNWVGAPEMFNLNQACRVVVDAFGPNVYLVGSALARRDYRDVDVRVILDDEDFDRRFPGLTKAGGPYMLDPLWSLLCSSISLYLSRHSGLPVDFQIQRRTEANDEYKGMRIPVGVFRYQRSEV